MGTIFVDNLEPQSGTSLTLGASGDTVSLGSGGTVTNTPSFFVKLSGNQTIPDNTTTVVTFDSEVFDTDSAYASNKFTVPSGKAGKYVFGATAGYSNVNAGTSTRFQLMFAKNGSVTDFMGDYAQAQSASADPTQNFVTAFDLSASDYVDVRVYHNNGASTTLQSAYARFFGYRIIGA